MYPCTVPVPQKKHDKKEQKHSKNITFCYIFLFVCYVLVSGMGTVQGATKGYGHKTGALQRCIGADICASCVAYLGLRSEGEPKKKT